MHLQIEDGWTVGVFHLLKIYNVTSKQQGNQGNQPGRGEEPVPGGGTELEMSLAGRPDGD